VIDDQVAFCGGCDIAPDRWDTMAHADRDARRRGIAGGIAPPRHEVMTLVEGPIARALGDLARERWNESGDRRPVAAPPPSNAAVWPDGVAADLTNAPCGLALTLPGWRGRPRASEVAALTTEAIAQARRTIYLENQYTSLRPWSPRPWRGGWPSRRGRRSCWLSTWRSVSWFDQLTMDQARSAQLWRLRAADVFGRFRAYAPVTQTGRAIIVHAKVMIVDDVLARIGSANLNNRSAGFDTRVRPGRRAHRRRGPGERAGADEPPGRPLGGKASGRDRPGASAVWRADRRAGAAGARPSCARCIPSGRVRSAGSSRPSTSAIRSIRPMRGARCVGRDQLYAKVRAQLAALRVDLEIHDQRQMVGGHSSERRGDHADGLHIDAAADEHMVDGQDRQG